MSQFAIRQQRADGSGKGNRWHRDNLFVFGIAENLAALVAENAKIFATDEKPMHTDKF
jgi:hypothetical protein